MGKGCQRVNTSQCSNSTLPPIGSLLLNAFLNFSLSIISASLNFRLYQEFHVREHNVDESSVNLSVAVTPWRMSQPLCRSVRCYQGPA